ncbi:hypothetical protein RhiJN_12948 [Ceratobasidium sp. AG-Ba]|nr:hypothetical protein RhiJN_12948 [Ceratobasidium sp. AG-Ba]QRW13518.1 hypothetical protein RhiLY_12517 [Ceratobasidium sp. AG-Ba]
MPIRKPRRQTLQELAYPPVPKIGGVDLRADEKILGIEDWEIGDRSRRYPTTQALSLLSSTDAGSRWGSSVGGSSVAGGRPSFPSTVGSQPSSGPSSPQKSSVAFPPSNPTTHHVKRKAPPSIDPKTSSSTVSSNPSTSASKLDSPSKADTSVSSVASSPPKRSFDGTVRPGDIVPPDWSPLTPAPSSAASRERRVSQPAPPPTSYQSLGVPRSNSHSRSRSHSQTLISAPSLPTITASPRPTLEIAPSASTKTEVSHSVPPSAYSSSEPTQVSSLPFTEVTSSLPSVAPLRVSKNPALHPPSPSRPSGSQFSSSSSVPPSRVPPAPSTISPYSSVSQRPPQLSSSVPESSLLQVPHTSPYGFTPPPAVAPPVSNVSDSHLGSGSHVSSSSRPRTASRTLPQPPGPPAALPAAASLALSGTRPAAASAPVSPVAGPQHASIAAWRSGVVASGPGWGASSTTMSHARSLPSPQAQSLPPHIQSLPPQIQSLPPQTQSYAPPAPPSQPAPEASQVRYQPAPLPTRTQQQPAIPPAHTRPAPATQALLPGSHNEIALPTQSTTTLGGYPSTAGQGSSGTTTKLTRKLTKSKGPSGSSAPPAPQVIQSHGSAFVSAQRALVGTHRRAEERIIWGLPLSRDPRVGQAVSKIEGMKDKLILFGAERFVQGRMRGAVMCNIDYRPPGHPDELAFDWITFKDAQKTLEPVLQKAILQTDPATSVLVVVFLLSPSLNSLAIWRKCVPIPSGFLDQREVYEIERVKREIAATEKGYVVKVW